MYASLGLLSSLPGAHPPALHRPPDPQFARVEGDKPRILLYSHDTMGLGHIRRNILIAQALADEDAADVLLVTGAREAGRFHLPRGSDLVVLPALHKNLEGHYASRHLALPLDELIALRSQMVLASVKSFRPDLVVIDNVVRGINGELDQALRHARSNGIRCVLGIRDIRDEPAAVLREWEQSRCYEALRNYYHEVWVYGDEQVYDPRHEYRLPPDIAAKFRFTGYFDQRVRLADAQVNGEASRDRYALCLVGGGQDGASLALAFAETSYPKGMSGIVLTGPYMDAAVRERLRSIAAKRPTLRVLDFMSEPTVLLRDAACVVTMGGYNSVSEVLSFEKPALIVPRVVPRREQLIRAERLHALGLVDVLHPNELTPERLGAWMKMIDSALMSYRARTRIDMHGLARISHLAAGHLERQRPATPLRVVS